MVIKFDHRHKLLDGDLLLTIACPVECDFCVYSCVADKNPKKWMPEKTIRRVAEQYSKNDIGIRVGGGDPFYDLQKLENCIKILLEYYKSTELLIITSGFFGTTKRKTLENLKIIKKFKLDTLTVSSDRFHLKKIPLENIENIIQVCKKLEIEPVLRISIDSESYNLIEKIAKIIVKNDVSFGVHDWGVFGRAEYLDASPLGNFNKNRDYFFSKIKEFALKYDKPSDFKYYLTHIAKRSQRNYATKFFPVTFPNGSVYGCSMALKGSYLGNINKKSLVEMLVEWKKSLPGFFCISNSSCNEVSRFLPDKYKHRCDFCRSHPFNIPSKEALGQKFLEINTDMDFDKIVEQNKNRKRELLLSFRLKKTDLNKKCGIKIKNFLDKLDQNKIKYTLSRPLPRCLGFITEKTDPKNCFECRELFNVKEGYVKYCDAYNGFIGYPIDNFKNRNQIYEYFEIELKNKKIADICKNCFFMLRKQCNGLCFRE